MTASNTIVRWVPSSPLVYAPLHVVGAILPLQMNAVNTAEHPGEAVYYFVKMKQLLTIVHVGSPNIFYTSALRTPLQNLFKHSWLVDSAMYKYSLNYGRKLM